MVIVSTVNAVGGTNLAPMSSAWWLGWSCMLGLDASSQTVVNLRRTGERVLDVASVAEADAVNRLALTTGRTPVPLHKTLLGYAHLADKFAQAGLAPVASARVAPAGVVGCAVRLEARVRAIRAFAGDDARTAVPDVSVELAILRAVVDEAILQPGTGRIDPLRWRPLLMSFRRLFAFGDECGRSRLPRGPEESYAPRKRAGLRRFAGLAVSAWSRRHSQADVEPAARGPHDD